MESEGERRRLRPAGGVGDEESRTAFASVLDMLPWRGESSVAPQHVDLSASSSVLDAAAEDSGEEDEGPPPLANENMMGKLIRGLLPGRSEQLVGPLELSVRAVTGDVFGLHVPQVAAIELSATITRLLEEQMGLLSKARRDSLTLDRLVQGVHIRSGETVDDNAAIAVAAAAAAAAATAAAAAAMAADAAPTTAATPPSPKAFTQSSSPSTMADVSATSASSSLRESPDQSFAGDSSTVNSGNSPPTASSAPPAPPPSSVIATGFLMTRLPTAIASCRRLTTLIIEGQHLETINEILAADLLEELRIMRCSLPTVPSHLLEKLPRLRMLDLRQNALTSFNQQGAYEKHVKLESVCLAYNQIATVPHSICRLTSVSDLDLSYNRLSSLPSEMRSLTNLVRLNLEGNVLVTPFASVALIRGVLGSIEVVTRLSLLRQINFSKNKITEMPAALAELTQLTDLNMSGNRLTRVHASIGSLELLDLSFNALGRTMPQEVMNMQNLTCIRLAHTGLREFPPNLGALPYLRELDVSHNKIETVDRSSVNELHSLMTLNASSNRLHSAEFTVVLRSLAGLILARNRISELPSEIGRLGALRLLDVSYNRIAVLPTSFVALANLEEVDLTATGIEELAPYWNVASFPRLRSLYLEGCPLAATTLHFSFSTLSTLKSISILGLHLVDVNNLYIQNPTRFDLQEFIQVAFNVRHPLLLSAFFGLASRPEYRESILSFGGVELMLSLCQMGLDNGARKWRVHDHWPPALASMADPDTARYFSLKVLTSLTHKMDANGPRWTVYMHGAPAILMGIINRHPDTRFKLLCIRLLGNLALHRTVKSQIFHDKSEIVQYLEDLARTSHSDSIKRFCNRTFAIFGICQHFHSGLSVAPLGRHAGVRILALDGGGTRSVATLEVLMRIRNRTGKRMIDMFDLIVGTSAGGMLALSMLLESKTLEEMADVYLTRGHLCFSPEDEVNPNEPPPSEAKNASSWNKTIRPMINLATRGSMYRAKTYEKELQKYFGTSTTMISTAENSRLPKVAVVACLTSIKPAEPYLCRNYDYPSTKESRYRGDVTWKLWEVARATSAAPSYFDPFERDGLQLMDGGLVCNNPAAVAYHEYLKIWGRQVPISLILSIGTGSLTPVAVPKERGMMETFEQLANAALSQERIHECMQDMLPDSVPYFRLQPTGPAFGARLDEIRRSELEKLQAATRAWMDSNEKMFEDIAAILNEKPPAFTDNVIWHDEYSESTDDIRLLQDVVSSEDDEDEDMVQVFSSSSYDRTKNNKTRFL